MPRALMTIGLLVLSNAVVFGQQASLVGFEEQKDGAAAAPRAPADAPLSPGYFAAPPQNGTTVGGTRSYGIDGPALHLPALTLKLPTLQLPSLVRLRTNPRMLIDPAQAPYVQQSPMAYGAAVVGVQGAQGARAPQDGDGRGQRAPQQPDGKAQPFQNDSTRYELQRRLDASEQQLVIIGQQVSRLAGSVEALARATSQREAEQQQQQREMALAPLMGRAADEAPPARPAGNSAVHYRQRSFETPVSLQSSMPTMRRLPPARSYREPPVQLTTFAVDAAAEPVPPVKPAGATIRAARHPATDEIEAAAAPASAGNSTTGVIVALLSGAILGAGLMLLGRSRPAGSPLPVTRLLFFGRYSAGYIEGRSVSVSRQR